MVLGVLGDEEAEDLAWWVDILGSVSGRPRLIALAHHPSMDLIVKAEQLGVHDVLTLPLRREAFHQAIERLLGTAAEVPLDLPPVERYAAGAFTLVGQSPPMVDVYKTLARVGPSAATVLMITMAPAVPARTCHGRRKASSVRVPK